MLKELKQIEDWFADESRWCQLYSRQDRGGFPLNSGDPRVAKRCLGEAIFVFGGEKREPLASLFLHELRTDHSFVDPRSIVTFNDSSRTTIEDVRALIRKVRDGILKVRIADEVELVKERALRANRILQELNEDPGDNRVAG